jgi:hypothetical protein
VKAGDVNSEKLNQQTIRLPDEFLMSVTLNCVFNQARGTAETTFSHDDDLRSKADLNTRTVQRAGISSDQ